MTGVKFWLGKVAKTWLQLLVTSGTVLALGACGPGLDSLAPFSIGGTISGLDANKTVTLQNNGGDSLNVTGNGSFKFATEMLSNAAYAVTVLTQPSGQICTVANGSGAATVDVTTVSVQCIWTGTRQYGAALETTFGRSVATDASGNVYVAGYTTGVLDGIMLMGNSDFFVAKYDNNGARQYTRQLGVPGTFTDTFGTSVATDASGNVYVAGYTFGGLDGNTRTGVADSFVTKYNSIGDKQYTLQLGVAGEFTDAYAVATDASGNVYVVGDTYGDLDGNTLMGTPGFSDFFITKYNRLGVKQYTRQLGVAGADTVANSVVTDASGNVYVAGYTTGGLGSNSLIGIGGSDFFLAKFNSDGAIQYVRQQGVAGASTASNSVACDPSGNVYIVGETTGILDGNALTGTSDFFLAKFSSDGVEQYIRQLGATGANTIGRSVATDASGNVFVAGETTGGLNGNTQAGTSDFFVMKFNSSGTRQVTRQLGTAAGSTKGYSVATDVSGNVYIAGETTGGLDGNARTGFTDFFLTKYTNALLK